MGQPACVCVCVWILFSLVSFCRQITGTSGHGGMEKQMAVFQSLRIPHFCANSEAGVSESRIWAMPEVLVATGEPSPDGWDKAEVTVAIIRD